MRPADNQQSPRYFVTRMGFEPMSFSVKGRCPKPLDERAVIFWFPICQRTFVLNYSTKIRNNFELHKLYFSIMRMPIIIFVFFYTLIPNIFLFRLDYLFGIFNTNLTVSFSYSPTTIKIQYFFFFFHPTNILKINELFTQFGYTYIHF
jgi:hypothetical protein